MTGIAQGVPSWTRPQLDAYLEERYVTRDRLAVATDLNIEILDGLVAAGCIPGPSYQLRHREELYAFINGDVNTISERTVEDDFATDVIVWIGMIAPRLHRSSPEELAPVLKTELREGFCLGLIEHGGADIGYEGFVAPDGTMDAAGLEAHFEGYIWPNWCEGTWGICVYGSEHIQNVARKTVAVSRLRFLTADGSRTEYHDKEAKAVHAAMVEYDAIVPPFSPHDRHDSSRARLVEALGCHVGYDPG